jgi:hypothetical protein
MSATAVAELASVPHGCDLLCENEMALFTVSTNRRFIGSLVSCRFDPLLGWHPAKLG